MARAVLIARLEFCDGVVIFDETRCDREFLAYFRLQGVRGVTPGGDAGDDLADPRLMRCTA